MKPYKRPLSRGMRLAAWAAFGHVGFELFGLALMVGQSAPAQSFIVGMGLEMGAVVGLGILMLRGMRIAYVVLAACGVVRLLVGALALDAVMTGEVERVDPLLLWGMLIAIPFAFGWIIGLIASWRAGRPGAAAIEAGVRDA